MERREPKLLSEYYLVHEYGRILVALARKNGGKLEISMDEYMSATVFPSELLQIHSTQETVTISLVKQ